MLRLETRNNTFRVHKNRYLEPVPQTGTPNWFLKSLPKTANRNPGTAIICCRGPRFYTVPMKLFQFLELVPVSSSTKSYWFSNYD